MVLIRFFKCPGIKINQAKKHRRLKDQQWANIWDTGGITHDTTPAAALNHTMQLVDMSSVIQKNKSTDSADLSAGSGGRFCFVVCDAEDAKLSVDKQKATYFLSKTRAWFVSTGQLFDHCAFPLAQGRVAVCQ